MTVIQKLGMILENKVVQKLKLGNNVFNKKWSPKLILLNEKIIIKNYDDFDIKNRLSKYDIGTFR